MMATAVELDPAILRQELAELAEQRGEVGERLRNYSGGRGRGRGFTAGRGRPSDNGLPSRDSWQAPQNGHSGRDGPTPTSSYGARNGSGNGRAWGSAAGSGEAPKWRPDEELVAEGSGPLSGRLGALPGSSATPPSSTPGSRGTATEEAPEPVAAPKPRLMSSVVVRGERLVPRPTIPSYNATNEVSSTGKRPPAREIDSSGQKRARRMFGSLLGTLAKASEEELQFKKTNLAQRREEAMKKAEQRGHEQQKAAREAARAAEIALRQAEVAKHRELGALTQVKRVELAFAERFRREAQLANFIRTAAVRPLLWLPAQHSAGTLALLHDEQKRLDTWKSYWELAVSAPRGLAHSRLNELMLAWREIESDAELILVDAEKQRIFERLPSAAQPIPDGSAPDNEADADAPSMEEEEVLEEGAAEAQAEEADEQQVIDAEHAAQRPGAQHAQQGADEHWEPSSSEEPAEDARDLETLEAFDGGLEDAETVADLLR